MYFKCVSIINKCNISHVFHIHFESIRHIFEWDNDLATCEPKAIVQWHVWPQALPVGVLRGCGYFVFCLCHVIYMLIYHMCSIYIYIYI